jgi:hypothetical protein
MNISTSNSFVYAILAALALVALNSNARFAITQIENAR